MRLDGDDGSALKIFLEVCQNFWNNSDHLKGAQALESQTNHRRPLAPETARIEWKSASSVTTYVPRA